MRCALWLIPPPIRRSIPPIPLCLCPAQYGQEKPLGKLRQAWWGVNVLLRLQLAKLCPSIFQPQIFTLVQNPTLSYTEVLRRANRTTAMLQLLLLTLAVLALAVAKSGLLIMI
jgi:hypothetical protein